MEQVLSGPNVILGLKVAVIAVTVLLLASLAALLRRRYRLHGRLNLTFFILTVSALVGFEVVIHVVNPNAFTYIYADESLRLALTIHLCFSVPSAALMPAMLWTGLTHRGAVHLTLSLFFGVLWAGTFVTGVFFLPHAATP